MSIATSADESSLIRGGTEEVFWFSAKWRLDEGAWQDEYRDRVTAKGVVSRVQPLPDFAGLEGVYGSAEVIKAALGPTPPGSINGDVRVSFDLTAEEPRLFVAVGRVNT